MQPLITKYKPRSTAEIIGQENGIREMRNFIMNYPYQKKKALLIYGQSGIGKTSSVYALANELKLELVEVNASDFRNQSQILLRVGNAIKQKSLFNLGKLILIDEVDGIAGMEDRGGLQTILKLIDETRYPIILTMNDPFDNKFNTLRSKCQMIMFEKLNYQTIEGYLKRICHNEKLNIEDNGLRALALKSGGNLMSALNDIQSITKKARVSREDIELISYRDMQESIQQALLRIFKSTDFNTTISAFDNVKEDVEQQFLWIDENLPKEYTFSYDLANAYNSLSRADVFRGRIRINQYYRFLVYINAHLSAGISLSKNYKYQTTNNYSQTGRLLKIFWANQKSIKKKEVAKRLAERTHCSIKRALKDIPALKIIFNSGREIANDITAELGLTSEEVEWMKK